VTDFLGALEPDDRDALLALGIRRTYRAGATVAHELDEAGGVWVLVAGEVAASTLGPGGKEVVLGIARPGELVGELAALQGARRSATLTARTDVEAVAVPAADFRRFLRDVPGAALAVLYSVVGRLQVADVQRRDMASLDVVARVAGRVLELSGGAPGGMVAVTHDELAAMTGASREAVTKALAVLRSLGGVRTHRGRIEVVDPEVVRRRAVA
jgi:CRP/FNR family transcriptional regulator, cyclic AMP receptor protein